MMYRILVILVWKCKWNGCKMSVHQMACCALVMSPCTACWCRMAFAGGDSSPVHTVASLCTHQHTQRDRSRLKIHDKRSRNDKDSSTQATLWTRILLIPPVIADNGSKRHGFNGSTYLDGSLVKRAPSPPQVVEVINLSNRDIIKSSYSKARFTKDDDSMMMTHTCTIDRCI